MKNWTFGQQFAVLLGIAVVCSILSFVTRIGWFHNLGWLLYGLLFLVHPVWPRSWDYADHDKLRLGLPDRRRADDPGGAGDPVWRMNRIVCKIKRAQAPGIGACALFCYGWD